MGDRRKTRETRIDELRRRRRCSHGISFPHYVGCKSRGIWAHLRLRSCISLPCWLEIRARNEEKDALFPPPQGQKAKANFLPNLTFFVRKMARLVLSSFQRAITILQSLAEVNFLGGGECALINGPLISPPTPPCCAHFSKLTDFLHGQGLEVPPGIVDVCLQ